MSPKNAAAHDAIAKQTHDQMYAARMAAAKTIDERFAISREQMRDRSLAVAEVHAAANAQKQAARRNRWGQQDDSRLSVM